MTIPLKHSRQKGFKTRQRDRATSQVASRRGSGRGQEQLDLFATDTEQPKAKHQPKEPLIVTPEKTAHHWPRKRYRLSCAYTGESMGVPLYGDEVERILSKFKGRRSPVTKTELWKTLEAISKDKRQQIREVAA